MLLPRPRNLLLCLCIPAVTALAVAAPGFAEDPPLGGSASPIEAFARAIATAESRSNDCDAIDKATTQAGRICQSAAREWLAAADLGERSLAEVTADEERLKLRDDIAGARYNAAVLLLSVGGCTEAEGLLMALAARPEVLSNPALRDRVANKLAVARACLAEQRAVTPSPQAASPAPQAAPEAAPAPAPDGSHGYLRKGSSTP